MMQPPRLHLFQAFGVELEYMIVDRDSLNVLPIADELLKSELGEYGSDFENGIVTWSNELVLHVIEMKSTRPESNFNTLAVLSRTISPGRTGFLKSGMQCSFQPRHIRG